MVKLNEEQRKQIVERLKGAAPEFATKIQPIYRLLNWTWQDEPNPPTGADIESTLLELIEHLLQENTLGSSTGGLSAWVEEEETGEISFGINFKVGVATTLDHDEMW